MSIKQTVSLVTLVGTNEQTAATSVTQTATAFSREFRELASYNRIVLFLDVSAVSGTTPSLTVTLQQQDPTSSKWSTVVSFPAQTAVTGATPITPIQQELYGVCYRLLWTISGTTPSFTFTCCGVMGTEEPATG